ncbi:Fe-S cluster assembly protein HesB [Metaclostridioides mangenotii]|jgi:iron-sulfur cluster insertion protein|uniref:Fe-S cluster assembly iron-binding protein IscA n=1 Tax=Metaclostridioides mangenotii TaxID=1540 RepID=A0ABS4E863_9FIRM|nr:Fe-S cluster assembly protein HesB [Clostridioides mangenotii]MBP1854113.1 Fe-S cluster assembly iron-binding protein IscA [Clostridioides mangenotii]
MKVTLPETAAETLKNILDDNKDKPNSIRVYFEGVGCSGPSFGLALDEQKKDDFAYETGGLNFIMNMADYQEYGDIVIEDSGYGFRVVPENMEDMGGCSGCSGCGN